MDDCMSCKRRLNEKIYNVDKTCYHYDCVMDDGRKYFCGWIIKDRELKKMGCSDYKDENTITSLF